MFLLRLPVNGERALLTFEDRVHRLAVQLTAHPDEEELLRALGQVVDDQLLVRRDRLHDLVDRLTLHLGADHVHLRPVRFRHSQKPDPVAVAYRSSINAGDLVVQSKPVSNL